MKQKICIILIADTNVNYPVMHTPDTPDFYLKAPMVIAAMGLLTPTLMPTDCFVLRTSTILPNIRISWDYHPTFMLISGRVLRSFTHL